METNELIRFRRIELGMTMKDLAKRVGVSEATISRWESGDIANMKRDKIAALARALDVSPAVLMNWEEFDTERMKKNKHAKRLYDLALNSDIKNVDMVYDILKRLEGIE